MLTKFPFIEEAGKNRFPITQTGVFSLEDGADVGTDEGTRVTEYDYSPEFTGKIENIRIDVHRQNPGK